ncbi:hypothetical protein VTN96DRAFT_6680 [Rasamsonia emersonii]
MTTGSVSTGLEKKDVTGFQDDNEILRQQIQMPEIKVSYRALFRYSSSFDRLILSISIICALAAGAALPLMTVVFGQLAGTFQAYFAGAVDDSHFSAQLHHRTLYFIYLAVGEFLTVYVSTVGFIHNGERNVQQLREHYLSSVLTQNIGLFDKLGAGEVTSRITSDMNLIQDGISQKLGLTLTGVSTFFTALIIAFVKSWKLTLILISGIFAMFLSIAVVAKFIARYNKLSLESQGLAATFAEEILSSIKIVVAFDTNGRLAKKFDESLAIVSNWGFKSRTASSCLIGAMLWDATLSDVLTILLAVMMAGSSLGSIAPYIGALSSATAAGGRIFSMIDRKLPADPISDDGDIFEHVEGNIEFRNVRLIYPTRPEVDVLRNFSLTIPAGKTTAIVGISGSGKSSIIGLIERFYDPIEGQVLLDGHDLRTLNLRWLRQQLALVSQEPVLFQGSAYQNIEYGLIGTEFEHADREIKSALVVQAAKEANAHNFLIGLPDGYNTNVGERGFLLSGGQKQRIAIARALIRDPKILLLDEATSSLDTQSESIVQQAINKAAIVEGRTTIVIAHRLSTIKDADDIVVLSEGKIVEQGTHAQLLALGGTYKTLVEAQRISESNIEELDQSIDEINEKEKEATWLKQHEPNRYEPESGLEAPVESIADRIHGYSTATLINFIWSFQKQDLIILTIGLLSSIVCGGGMPTQAVFLGKSVATLSSPPGDRQGRGINFWSLMYLMLAIVELFAFITPRISNLSQEIAYFEQENNSAGAMTSLLISDANRLAAAISISTAIGWKLGLTCAATIPVLIFCGFARFWLLARFEVRARKAYNQSANFACEAISGIRTIASLTRECDVCHHYHDLLTSQVSHNLASTLRSSVLYAASQSLTFLCMALGFWYGGTLISSGQYSMLQFFICFTAVIFGAQSAGGIFSYSPDMGRAKQAAQSFKELFSREPRIASDAAPITHTAEVEGMLEFRNINFSYPSRPGHPVLKNLSLSVNANQYVALVGPSGCGKTTCIGLIERFYEPDSGAILLDGKDISKLNIQDYRKYLAIVSQDPFLYGGTIKDNLLLGAVDDTSISMEKMVQACKDANIYDFITSLPEGFDTVIGSKGTTLSGGQKQRLAIARALIREPKILLLDEATSALDSESEAAVQTALDAARHGRTTIAVAHRLSTIQNADVIYVLSAGEIVESGSHSDLMAKGGQYAQMVRMQSLEKIG